MTLRPRKTADRPVRRAHNVVAMPRQGGMSAPPPPHLEVEEQQLWASLTATFELDDDASLAVLLSGLEARGRARRMRLAIDEQGETIMDQHGLRPHPLLAHERASTALFLTCMKQLRLDSVT